MQFINAIKHNMNRFVATLMSELGNYTHEYLLVYVYSITFRR